MKNSSKSTTAATLKTFNRNPKLKGLIMQTLPDKILKSKTNPSKPKKFKLLNFKIQTYLQANPSNHNVPDASPFAEIFPLRPGKTHKKIPKDPGPSSIKVSPRLSTFPKRPMIWTLAVLGNLLSTKKFLKMKRAWM